jgi:hypothetical protein
MRFTMLKSLLVFMCFAFFVLCSNLIAQDVVIYNDKSPAWIDPAQMVPAAQKALDALNVKNDVVNAADLVTYMNANQTGIVIIATGIAPGEIFKNQGDKDLVHKWLFDGGVMLWTGDWPFYYWDVPGNCPGSAGETSVFGVIVTASVASTKMKPTDIGKKLIPSIKEGTSQRPIMLTVLDSSKFNYESYADDGGTYADPIALQAPKMKGWFVNMHTWPEGATTLDQVGKDMAEVIKNRFLVTLKAVDKMSKLTTTWGDLKVK